jgi:hypothetical protein
MSREELEMANRTGGGPFLFAYDGSEPSKASIREAAAHLSAGRDAIVLTVWEPLTALPLAGGAVMSPEVEEDFAERARNAADEGAGLAVSAGFKATPLAERGNPVWRTIVDAADEHDAGIGDGLARAHRHRPRADGQRRGSRDTPHRAPRPDRPRTV